MQWYGCRAACHLGRRSLRLAGPLARRLIFGLPLGRLRNLRSRLQLQVRGQMRRRFSRRGFVVPLRERTLAVSRLGAGESDLPAEACSFVISFRSFQLAERPTITLAEQAL